MSVSNAINQDTNQFVKLSGSTMTGDLILNTSSPTTALQSASKGYVDSVAGTLNIQTACLVGTTATLNAVYANGTAGVGATLTNNGALAAFSVDGVSPAINSRVLVKDQSSQVQNGIYTLTTVGDGATAWVLTRATDFDAPSEIHQGDYVVVTTGTVNGGNGFVQSAVVATIGSDNITFSRIGSTVYALKGANADITSMSGLTGNIGVPTSVTMATGGAYRTSTSAGNTALLQAYDTLGAAYTTFATLTANNPPTFDLATSTTIGTAYIYRAGGTDIPITDGGTGASTAADARTNLGLGTMAVQNSNAVTITGGSITTLSALSLLTSSSGATLTLNVENTSNTASSAANINVQTAGTLAGNPYYSCVVGSVGGWAVGLRQSSSNALAFCFQSGSAPTLSSSQAALLDTSGNFTANTCRPIATSNQLVLGTTRTVTITAPTPTATSNIGTIPDYGGDFMFPLATPVNTCFLTTTGNTNVTLPTSGTLLTSASAVTSITGTADQVIASAATGAVTLSLPQSIATTSSPTFLNPIVRNLVGDGSNTLLISNTGAATTLSSTTQVNISGSTVAPIEIITSLASTAGAIKIRALGASSTIQMVTASGTLIELGTIPTITTPTMTRYLVSGGAFVNTQGSQLSWNQITGGSGRNEYVNHRGGGGGGFYFYTTTDAATFTELFNANTSTFGLSTSRSGSGVSCQIENTNTNANSDATVNLQVANVTNSDPFIRYVKSTVGGWAHGMDTGDSNRFVFAYNGAGTPSLGSTGLFKISTAGILTISDGTNATTITPSASLLSINNSLAVGGSDNRGILTVQKSFTDAFAANTDPGDSGRLNVTENTSTSNAVGLYSTLTLQANPNGGLDAGRILADIRLVRRTANESTGDFYFSGFRQSSTYEDFCRLSYDTSIFYSTIQTISDGSITTTMSSALVASSGELKLATNGTTSAIILSTAQAVRFPVYGTGTITSDASGNLTSVSDERMKQDIDLCGYGLNEILALVEADSVITYRYSDDSGLDTSTKYAGFSAQGVKDIIPEAVGIDSRGYYTFSDRPIIAALVNAVAELQQQINDLRNK